MANLGRQDSTGGEENRALQFGRSLIIAAVTIFVLWQAVKFMADEDANKFLAAIVGLIVGAGGVWALFWTANDLLTGFAFKLRERIRPIVFVGPAILLLGTYLVYPAVNTIWTSFTEDIIPKLPEVVPAEYWAADNIIEDFATSSDKIVFESYVINRDLFELAKVQVDDHTVWLLVQTDTVDEEFVFTIRSFGLANYRAAFTDDEMQIAYRNNVLWLIVGTGGSVIIGLLFATFVDRIKREALAKTFVFLPLAISMVGASVIWRFIYYWQPTDKPQIGLMNAVHLSTCNWWEGNFPSIAQFFFDTLPFLFKNGTCDAVSWLRIEDPPINTLALIVIIIWVQTGFAMVVLSAALKGVPNSLLEAARIDGANEFQIFFRIIIPVIRGSIITVTTTIFIAILKVFDIVFVMTRGQNDTEVVANRMFKEAFNFFNFGRASALAVILLIAVIPIIVVNIRNLRMQGINQ
ncbi:MAG: sugar ABC transporter permease [Chloroflexi bacterium]|nr:sugar ABC transporter permease [Chloroflexota bacterium]